MSQTPAPSAARGAGHLGEHALWTPPGSPPHGWSRSCGAECCRNRLAPRPASRLAMAYPMPARRLTPVTSAARPRNGSGSRQSWPEDGWSMVMISTQLRLTCGADLRRGCYRPDWRPAGSVAGGDDTQPRRSADSGRHRTAARRARAARQRRTVCGPLYAGPCSYDRCMTDEAGGHVAVTRRQWDGHMSAWFERSARSRWAAAEPYWGILVYPPVAVPGLKVEAWLRRGGGGVRLRQRSPVCLGVAGPRRRCIRSGSGHLGPAAGHRAPLAGRVRPAFSAGPGRCRAGTAERLRLRRPGDQRVQRLGLVRPLPVDSRKLAGCRPGG